jgi:hypothetical protein
LLAGLRAKVGPHSSVEAAYRQWYARHMEDHERMQIAMLENLSRREVRDAGGVVVGRDGGEFDLWEPHFIAAATCELQAALVSTLTPSGK